jgi:hypothetical protein
LDMLFRLAEATIGALCTSSENALRLPVVC